MNKTAIFLVICTLLIPVSCIRKTGSQAARDVLNQLTPDEQSEGWQLLFDGKTFRGWRGLGTDSIPKGHWIIEDGNLRKVASGKVPRMPDGQPVKGGDLMTADTFLNFELTFEWKISTAGNSGVKYNVSEALSTKNGGANALGFEYQIIDDQHFPEPLKPAQHTGSLYDLVPAKGAHVLPDSLFNHSRILLDRNHGEHWLNGIKVVEYTLGTPGFDSLFRESKFRTLSWFPVQRYGHIVLQDHGDDVWFRNIKIRTLENNKHNKQP